jgi:hypothetical protein
MLVVYEMVILPEACAINGFETEAANRCCRLCRRLPYTLDRMANIPLPSVIRSERIASHGGQWARVLELLGKLLLAKTG